MTENTCNVAYNVRVIRETINETCIKYGRNVEDIVLMGVSKTQPIEKIRQAFDAGITLFGENRVQELSQKIDFFRNTNTKCSMIGQLQTNKVKYLPELTDTIQSVDSLKLAKEIEKQFAKSDKIANVCVEVNIGNEESKGGIEFDQVTDFIYQISEFKNLKVKGLMCIPPICEGESVRKYFEKMKKLFVDISDKKIYNVEMDILSMGMSGDYKWAIAEGSTQIRVGTGVFGARDYNNT